MAPHAPEGTEALTTLDQTTVEALTKAMEAMQSGDHEFALWGWGISVLLAICGWLFGAYKQRQLQRKQLAVQLLSGNRFESAWVDGLSHVFRTMYNYPDYEWHKLAEKRYGRGVLEGDDLVLFDHLKTVLNYLEFVAIAVLNKAADEDIIRWSLETHYVDVNKTLKKFVEATRGTLGDDVFINFTSLAERWSVNKGPARPTS